jgi:hypothetical protein
MKTFCIMTPTIPGREFLLERAMESVRRQTYGDYVHLVYGDGPNPRARELCSQGRFSKAEYRERPEKGGGWGYKPRNQALNDTPDLGRYWMFLDDDNYLFEDCLEVLSGRVGKSVMIYDMLYYSGIWQQWLILPPTRHVEANCPERSKIDMGNFAVRWDVARQVKFNDKVGNDFDYVDECCKVAGYDIEWITGKPLLVYGFAPFGRAEGNQIVASFDKVYQ